MEDKNQYLDMIRKFAIPLVFISIIFIAGVCLYWAGMRYKSSTNAIVEGGHAISVASRVAGQVKTVYVENNKSVKGNSLIVELDSQGYEVQLKNILTKIDDVNAKLEQAGSFALKLKSEYDDVAKVYNEEKAKLEHVEDDYTKSAGMYKEGIITKQEYDNILNNLTLAQGSFQDVETRYNDVNTKYTGALSDVKSLDAELKSLEQDLLQAKYNLSNAKIFAPEDGIVTNFNLKQGASLKAAQVFMTLNPTKVWVVANYRARYFDDVENGQTVWIKLDICPNKKFKGHIESISPYQDKKLGEMVTVKVLFDESVEDYDIKPGKSVVLKLRERG